MCQNPFPKIPTQSFTPAKADIHQVPAKLESFKALMFKYYPEFYQQIQCEPLEI